MKLPFEKADRNTELVQWKCRFVPRAPAGRPLGHSHSSASQFSVAASAHAPCSDTSSVRQLPALLCCRLCSAAVFIRSSHRCQSHTEQRRADRLTNSTAVRGTEHDIQRQRGDSESDVPLHVRTRDPQKFTRATGSRGRRLGLLESGSASALLCFLTVMGFSGQKEPGCG